MCATGATVWSPAETAADVGAVSVLCHVLRRRLRTHILGDSPTMMHLWITAADNWPTTTYGAMVAVPERQCLTYAAELIPHLRSGSIVHIYIIGPDGNHQYEWRFKCT